MALRLTSRGLQGEVARQRESFPYTACGGTALASSSLFRLMKPGGAKTLVELAAVGGGVWFASGPHGPIAKGVAHGIAMGGLWNLLMR